MRVTVRFLGALDDQVGTASLPIELAAGQTYRDVLEVIAATMEEKLADWAWDRVNRSFSRRMLVSLNGSADLRDETTRLADGDEILVVLPLAGG